MKTGERERERALWAETEPQHEMGLYVYVREGGREGSKHTK